MEQLRFEQDDKINLKEKYDAKNHAGVRGVRKQLMLDKNPDIVKEKGREWIEYLYNTPVSGELEAYRNQLQKKLENSIATEIVDVADGNIFDPSVGSFKGFLSEEEKESAIKYIQAEIDELTTLIEK